MSEFRHLYAAPRQPSAPLSPLEARIQELRVRHSRTLGVAGGGWGVAGCEACLDRKTVRRTTDLFAYKHTCGHISIYHPKHGYFKHCHGCEKDGSCAREEFTLVSS